MSDLKQILVLHTGGTIGMASGPMGLAPAKGLVEAAVKSMAPKGFQTELQAFDPLVDSAEIGPAHWNRLIDAIVRFDGNGVVITHGTDTLAFTGAALSQSLAGISIPVLLCGAMHPLGVGGDAEANLSLALKAAGEHEAGVWLAFAGQVMPASGLVKLDSHAENAFRATPQAALSGPFNPRRFSDLRLAIVTLSPGLPVPALSAMLAGLDGAVVRVFGAGTAPSDPALAKALFDATARGCRIRAVSQCGSGGLEPGAYAAGAHLWQAGVENGGMETPEAALVRLWIEMSGERYPF